MSLNRKQLSLALRLAKAKLEEHRGYVRRLEALGSFLYEQSVVLTDEETGKALVPGTQECSPRLSRIVVEKMCWDFISAKVKVVRAGTHNPLQTFLNGARGVVLKLVRPYRTYWKLTDIDNIERVREKKTFILVNGALSERQQVFTILHELAHEILEHEDSTRTQDDDIYELALREHAATAFSDLEANYLAGVVLMPEVLVRQFVHEHGYDVPALANRFDVTQETAAHRLVEVSHDLPLHLLAVDASGRIRKTWEGDKAPVPFHCADAPSCWSASVLRKDRQKGGTETYYEHVANFRDDKKFFCKTWYVKEGVKEAYLTLGCSFDHAQKFKGSPADRLVPLANVYSFCGDHCPFRTGCPFQ